MQLNMDVNTGVLQTKKKKNQKTGELKQKLKNLKELLGFTG